MGRFHDPVMQYLVSNKLPPVQGETATRRRTRPQRAVQRHRCECWTRCGYPLSRVQQSHVNLPAQLHAVKVEGDAQHKCFQLYSKICTDSRSHRRIHRPSRDRERTSSAPPSSPMDTTSPIITTVGTVSNHRVGLHARCGTVHVAAETRGAALSTRGEAKRQDGDARRGAALSTRGEAKRRDGDTRSQALKCSNNV